MSICTAKVVTGLALFFALVAVILKSVALSVPHFVDVHLVDDPSNANDGNRLGGVGVFQSEFDSDLEGDIAADIQAANVPILTLNLPTTEFPLLFPAQENFIADVLPVNQELLDGLLVAVPGASGLQAGLNAVNALELENDDCETFATDARDAVGLFFNILQTDAIPEATAQVSSDIPISTAARIINAISFNFGGAQTAEGAAVQITLGAAAEVFGNLGLVLGIQNGDVNFGGDNVCSDNTITISADLDITIENNRLCVLTLFNAANNAAPQPVLAFIIALLAPGICPATSTVAGCIQDQTISAKFVSVDTNMDDPATFANPLPPSVCDDLFDCTTKESYLEDLADFMGLLPNEQQEIREQLIGAINAYLGFFGAGLVDGLNGNANTTFANGFASWPQANVAQSTFAAGEDKNQLYTAPCSVILPLVAPANCTTLEQYLVLLPSLLEDAGDPLAPTVRLITDLYAAFFDSELTGNLALGAAPSVFTLSLIEAAFNADFETQDVVAEATAACDDDVEDLEKITQAQALAAASTAFEAVAVLLIIVGIILPVERLAILAGFASVAGILGGVFILAALFVVESAPVYDGVGESGEEGGDPEIFFIQGYVPILALIDAILFFLSGVLLIAATVMACKESGETAVANVDEVKADGPMEDKI